MKLLTKAIENKLKKKATKSQVFGSDVFQEPLSQ